MDDVITSYLLKTCLMNLLPRHSQTEKCGCNDNSSDTENENIDSEACKWLTVERHSACDWAIRIYLREASDRLRSEEDIDMVWLRKQPHRLQALQCGAWML